MSVVHCLRGILELEKSNDKMWGKFKSFTKEAADYMIKRKPRVRQKMAL